MTTDNWTGVLGSPCEHRSVGPGRAWCMTCGEWCYRGPAEVHCRWCEDWVNDLVSVGRSALVRWAQYARAEVGLDAIVEEIGAILGGEQ